MNTQTKTSLNKSLHNSFTTLTCSLPSTGIASFSGSRVFLNNYVNEGAGNVLKGFRLVRIFEYSHLEFSDACSNNCWV